jgi:hypothetical protein
MEQVVPKAPVNKAWPLMIPAERLAVWEEARLDHAGPLEHSGLIQTDAPRVWPAGPSAHAARQA